MCLSQNEMVLVIAIIIAVTYIIYHCKSCKSNETFADTPVASETCNLNNEGFLCTATCKAMGKNYYVNKGQGCSNACICP
jgi:hypothetical protein